MKLFGTFDAALSWARTHANESTFAHQFWRVVPAPMVSGRKAFAVGVYSRNTGALSGYAY